MDTTSRFHSDHAKNMAFQQQWMQLRTAISNETNIAKREELKAQLMDVEAERHELLKGASPVYLAFLFMQEMRGIAKNSVGIAGLPFRQKKIERWQDMEVLDLAEIAVQKLCDIKLLEMFQATYEAFLKEKGEQ